MRDLLLALRCEYERHGHPHVSRAITLKEARKTILGSQLSSAHARKSVTQRLPNEGFPCRAGPFLDYYSHERYYASSKQQPGTKQAHVNLSTSTRSIPALSLSQVDEPRP